MSRNGKLIARATARAYASAIAEGADPHIAFETACALAESALHAPFASFGGFEAYPALVEQAAVLLQHLVRNHPLPDANKRAAFLLTARFLDANGLEWKAQDVETDASMIERVAGGQATHEEVVAWIRDRTRRGAR